MPSISSGEVSSLTSTVLMPSSFSLTAFSLSNTTLPLPAPGDAGSPFAITLPAFNAASSKVGCKSASS